MLTTLFLWTATQTFPPIRLHPDNPHLFEFRGKPTLLITSAEHYGAVLNLDFDYLTYLDALAAHGFNLTRTFTGSYMEHFGAFNIAQNTLAPKPNRLLTPWARSDTPGYPNGGNKFDLSRWDDAYFARLRDFCEQASRRGIVVEIVLFCPFYGEEQWNLSPMKASNNVNGVGAVPRTEVLTLRHPSLVAVQEAMTRQIVNALRDFDNVYYEICNEPYFGGVTLDWQAHIASVIHETERDFPTKHLIAQNIANGSAKIENPHPAVSIFNFHYAFPPTAVAENYGLNRVIAFDETGFRGVDNDPYRTEAWQFILAGGAVYNHLDYSFTAEHPNGTFAFPPSQPGGGGPELRRQLEILRDFINGFDFVRMKPHDETVCGGVPENGSVRVLAEPGVAYAIHVLGGSQAQLALNLPAGRYRADWVNTKTGAIDKTESLEHDGGEARLASPPYETDIALRIRRL